MVELVQAGRKPSELAKEFNCQATSILSWVRQSGGSTPAVVAAHAQGQALSTAERQELIELTRKLRQVQMERDIWGSAFGRRQQRVLIVYSSIGRLADTLGLFSPA